MQLETRLKPQDEGRAVGRRPSRSKDTPPFSSYKIKFTVLPFLQIKTDVTGNEEVSYVPQSHSSKEKPAPAFKALARGRTALIKSAQRG